MPEAIKQCPFCSEMVPKKAIKCRHCGEFLQDYQPAPGGAGHPKKITIILLVVAVLVVGLPLLAAAILITPTLFEKDESPPIDFDIKDACNNVADAQEEYFEKTGMYGSLAQLVQEKLLDSAFGKGEISGYEIELELSEDGNDWGMRAWPKEPTTESQSYYIDSTKEMRFESYRSHSDEKAGPDSPPYWGEEDWGSDE
jgi:hypothetical protein